MSGEETRLSRARTQREGTERRGVRENWGDGGYVGYTLLAPPNLRKTPVPPNFWFRTHICGRFREERFREIDQWGGCARWRLDSVLPCSRSVPHGTLTEARGYERAWFRNASSRLRASGFVASSPASSTAVRPRFTSPESLSFQSVETWNLPALG